MKKVVFLLIGFLSLGVGCIGVVIPMLPSVPFFLVTAYCFARSSERLHQWFVGTKLYKKHLESFVQKRGMTSRTKAGILISVTLVMGFGFLMMDGLIVPRAILATVWAVHIVYFLFGVKTIRQGSK